MENALTKNSEAVCEITGCTHDGLGVARADGRVLFVRGGARGDIARLRVTKVLANAAYARIEELLTPSPHRIAPDCPAFPRCGGCDFRHISYDEELRLKKDRAEDALRRIGGLSIAAEDVFASAHICRYRNKAAFPVGFDRDGHPVTGYYRSRTHEIIPVKDCLLQGGAENAAAMALRGWIADTGFDGMRHLLLRRGDSGLLAALIALRDPPKEAPALAAALRNAVPELRGVVWQRHSGQGNAVLGGTQITLWGQPCIEDSMTALGGNGRDIRLTFRISVQSFYQVNKPQAQRFYRRAVEYAGRFASALDLYCGTGTLTQYAAAACPDAAVAGIEIIPEAVEDAKASARRNGLTNVTFLCGDAARAAGYPAQVVFLDPPRKGLDEAARAAVLDIAPETIVYMSCDPATLARDAKAFAAGGYAAERLTIGDFFPRTAHVESLLCLRRR